MRISIHIKIVLILTIFLSCVLGIIFLYQWHELKKITFQSISANLSSDTLIAKSYLESQMALLGDKENFQTFAEKLHQDLGLRTTVINADGQVIGESDVTADGLVNLENHFNRPEIQLALTKGFGENLRFSMTLHKNMLYVARALEQNGKITGFIRLAKPLAEIEHIEDGLRKSLIVSFCLVFAGVAVFVFFLAGYISSPIKNIALVAKTIADGSFEKKFFTKRNDEIGDLAFSINKMSSQIKTKMDELFASKSHLEAVLLNMLEGVMIVDKKGQITFVNNRLKDLFNIKGEFYYKKPIEIIRIMEIQDIVDKVLRVQMGMSHVEMKVALPSGEKILWINASPVKKLQQLEGAVLVFHDMTEIRRLEKIRQDFVANVSHELRTPVSTIKGYSETLLDGALQDSQNAKKFVQIIHDDADRLAKLINDLLDLSRIESGQVITMLTPCSIADEFNRVFSVLSESLDAMKINVVNNVSPEFPPILSDSNMLFQVFFNIIENAVKYNKPQGSITINAKEAGKEVVIEIKDTGIGISQNDLPRIFERFYRVDKAHSRQVQGTGLGLSIVKHILEALNGRVEIASEFGQGTTVTIYLPR